MNLDHKEKGPRELALHMDPLVIEPIQSIPQNSHYAPYRIASFFCGSEGISGVSQG
ncbi:hypothetical protein SAMN02745215_02903 [Desulfitobacterium chlororespirans DSM 11544]|uniref:Uncharacterized protein n=1 Tax=Desulfitobacterium chlororespirans DSM 11544 TaxID=1121395 RepID=A0A1M7U3S7_9FIRM|nr:hypothetical protein SAMN02745215_02903 [Desulfitobacterium chlororespirans DSM 11544]